MRFSNYSIVLQEVPGEITLCFTITGCKLACNGCHSAYLWKKNSGTELTTTLFNEIINKYKNLFTCVLFMGGEWHSKKLKELLIISKNNDLKTCLYTGLDNVDPDIISELTFLKTGEWKKELGGLTSLKTNQKFIDVKSNKILNHLFNPK